MQSPISFTRHELVAIAALVLVAACGGGSDGTTSPNGGSTSGFHMTIDGVFDVGLP